MIKRIAVFAIAIIAIIYGSYGIASPAFGVSGRMLESGFCMVNSTQREILWLARTIFSETKQPEEMELIGWVVRNRVETAYLGDTTYREVALRKHQFSGLNPYDKQYHINTRLSYRDKNRVWQKVLAAAERVYRAPEDARPFPISVKHFYSPKSVTRTPSWAEDAKLHMEIPGPKGYKPRFAFYSGVR